MRLLADPIFGPFFFGKLLSTGGIWIHNIVAAILAYQLTGSAFMVGIVSVAQFAPQILLAPLSGAMADRGDRRRQLVVGRLISAAGSGGLALWITLTGVAGLPGVAPVLLGALVVGVGFVIGGPALLSLLPSLVRPGELAPAVALNSVPPTISRAAGPAAGALIAASAGPATAFALAAGAHLVFAAVMARLLLGIEGGTEQDRGADRSVRAGLRHLRADPTLIRLLLGVVAIGIGTDPSITLTPPLSDAFGRGSQLVGALASAFGLGAGFGFLVLTPIRRRLGLPRLGVAGLILFAVGLLLLIPAPAPAVAMLAFAIGGTGMTLSITSLSTQIQERIPDDFRGRVMALWSVAYLGSRPAAASASGAIADAWSVDAALLTVAAVLVVAAWWCRPGRLAPLPSGRNLPRPAATRGA